MHMKLALALAAATFAGPALAQDSAKDGSAAVAAGSEAVTLLGASGVKTAVGVSALPTGVAAAGLSTAGAASGAVADSTGAAGAGLSEAAGQSAKAALKVDEEVVVAPDPAPKVPYQAEAKPR